MGTSACVCVPAGLCELQLISTFCLYFTWEVLDPFFLEKRFGNHLVPPPFFVCCIQYWLNSRILSLENSMRCTATRLGGYVGADWSAGSPQAFCSLAAWVTFGLCSSFQACASVRIAYSQHHV